MISFVVGYEDLLPYKKHDYLLYLDDDSETEEKWFGVSIQYRYEYGMETILEAMAIPFKQLVDRYDCGANWIVSHDDKDMPWFVKNISGGKVALLSLQAFFKRHKISTTFVGGLSLPREIILDNLIKDLIAYPVLSSPPYLYKDLSISHATIPLIIKVTGHMTIDVLSTEATVIDEVKNMNFPLEYKLRLYR